MSLLPIVQVVVAAIIIVLIIVQERGGGISGVFGGGGAVYHTRRGLEKVIFVATVIGVIVFALLALTAFSL